MQRMVAEAIAAGADVVEAEALAEQVGLYRSAVQIGITQTAARTSEIMRSTTRWPVGCVIGKTITFASPGTGGYRQTTTARNATSA